MVAKYSFHTACKRAILIAFTVASVLPAAAQGWPDRPIRIVAPYSAGGPLDTSARLVAAKLQESLGKPVVVESRPGAGGTIGSEAVAKSDPDGYTFLMGANATHAINPSLIGVPYDPLKDFSFVALVAQVPNVIVVRPDLPVKNVGELIEYARRNPGALNVSGTFGSVGHLANELFQTMTGTKTMFIRYKGSAPAMADLLAGRADLMFNNLASALPQIQAGQLRALAVTSSKRSSFLPDVPTLDESGLRGFDMSTWWGLMAPAKTPAPIVERMSAEVAKALATPTVKAKLRDMGSEPPSVDSPEKFRAYAASELELYSGLVSKAKENAGAK